MGLRPKIRVLVVDDVEILTHIMQIFLSRAGYQVETVNDSRVAINVLRQFKPDIVILDISMPYLNGYEIARRIRKEERRPHIPIIAVSAYSDDGHKCRVQQAGITHYMVKPCQFSELDRLIQSCAKR